MTSGVTPASDGMGGDPAIPHLQGEKVVVQGFGSFHVVMRLPKPRLF